MAGPGHQGFEALGVRQRAFGPCRGLDGMDIQVDRAGVARIALQHGLQRADDRRTVSLRLRAAGFPVVPGLRVHQRFDGQHLDRVLGRIARGDLLHRSGIGRVERAAFSLRIG
jgi:hypothetical protein